MVEMSYDIVTVNKFLHSIQLSENDCLVPKDFPDHSCNYCGIHNPRAVVQCGVCKRWFCNGQYQFPSSHIINHLMKAKHREAILHKDGLLRHDYLKCGRCGSGNVFGLGCMFTNLTENVDLCCRLPCAFQENSNNARLENWKPVIEDLKFVDWIVETPSQDDLKKAMQPPVRKIIALEETWKKANESLRAPSVKLHHVSERYEDGDMYQKIFAPLVKLEEDYGRRLHERQLQDKFVIRWSSRFANRMTAFFKISHKVDEDIRLMPGTKLRLRYLGEQNKPWSGVGHIFKIPKNYDSEFGVLLERGCIAPKHLTHNFAIDCLWNPTPYNRMLKALKAFAEDESAVSIYIYRNLLGHSVENVVYECSLPDNLSAPNLPTLNDSQALAVKFALKRPLSLIQGPPGTGKTVTSASIVYHLFQSKKERILVCAPSNVAVDHLAEQIHKTGLNVVRLCAKNREDVNSSVSFLALDNQISSSIESSDLKKLQDLRAQKGELSDEEEARFQFLKQSTEKELLKAADVICCTCVSAGDPRLRNLKFPWVLIDESTQATEPECLISLVNGVKQLVLVGDQCQLGPVVMCQEASLAGLGRTMFQRLLLLCAKPILLDVQYRMHPALSRFPSSLFYGGAVKDGITLEDRMFPNVNFPWPQPDKPIIFYASEGVEEISQTGSSFLNRPEAFLVEKIVSNLLRSGVKPKQIGVITPYDGQRGFLFQYMQCCDSSKPMQYQDIEIASVDAYQGREKDYVILSCVRSNKHALVGFLKDPRRLNVALTRARCGIIILGNVKVLSKHPLWYRLLVYCQKQKVLVEGSLDCLKECKVKFRTPATLIHRRNVGVDLKNVTKFGAEAEFISGSFS